MNIEICCMLSENFHLQYDRELLVVAKLALLLLTPQSEHQQLPSPQRLVIALY